MHIIKWVQVLLFNISNSKNNNKSLINDYVVLFDP